jgi:pimeloyl-ACP methyl ester carboxylesterase
MTGGLRRRFVTVRDERQVHYRSGGSGPVVVLMHESPLSSQSLVPLAEALTERFTVVALDTPGYGSSDPLASPETPEIPDYARAAAETLAALGIERCAVYGAHTGACIALELAMARPDLVACAVLDGLPVFTSEERASLLASYLPRFEAREDGSHLLTLWWRYRDQYVFFPWFDMRLDARLDLPLPSARRLQDGVLDLLRAGDGYRVAYAAAFRHDPAPALAAVSVPTAILAREGDLLATHLARVPGLPPGVETVRLGRARQEAVSWIGAFAARHLGAGARPEGSELPPPVWRHVPGRITRAYVDTSAGQLHVRGRPGADARPLVMLHASPGSARMLEPLVEELAPGRPVLAFDTLGNGESDKPPGWTRPTSWDPTGPREPGLPPPVPPWDRPWIGDYAAVVVEAIDALGLGEVDVYGSHTGGLIGVEVAIALGPERVRRLIVDGLAIFEPEERDDLLAHYTPPLEPRWDGSHLAFAWSFLRAQTEFWPWYRQTREGIRWVDPIPARALHTWVVELLKSGHTYPLAYNAAFAYPTRERLPLLETRTLIAAHAEDMLAPCSDEGARLARNAAARPLPDGIAAQAALYARFLDGEDV